MHYEKNNLLAFIIVLICFPAFLFAQEISNEFGQITTADFDLKPEGFLKDANAVVIYDIGDSEFIRSDYGFSISFKRNTRIKIFNEAGIENAEITIPYFRNDNFTESVSEIQATTYYLENGIITSTKLSKSHIYEEKINENWFIKKFTFPSVKAGSVIELSYTHYTPYKFHLQDWEFQSEIPTIYSQYTVHLIPFFNYFFMLQGADHFDKRDSWVETGLPKMYNGVEYRTKTHTFVMKNVPAFEDESFITSRDDYIIKLDFQLSEQIRSDGSKIEHMTTWENFIRDMLKNDKFGKFQKALERKSKSFVKENKLLDLDPVQRFMFIVDHVKSDYIWNNRNRLFSQQKPAEFLKNQKGNSSEINLYLTALLNAAGIEAYPLILSTRDHGKIKLDFPFYRFFNYVIVAAHIDNKIVLTDGTAIYLNNDKIPSKCFNDKGLIMREKTEDWIQLNDSQLSANFTSFQINISPEFDTIFATISDVSQLYVAERMKERYLDNPENLKQAIEKKGYEQVEVIETRSFDDASKPYIVIYSVQKGIDYFDDKYLIPPFLLEPVKTNPFKGKERTYPIDMTFPVQYKFMAEITIPEGYQLKTHPKPQSSDNEFLAIQYNVSTQKNTVTVNGLYEFKKAVYSSAKYESLKNFYNLVIKQFNESLVFEKKPESESEGDTDGS